MFGRACGSWWTLPCENFQGWLSSAHNETALRLLATGAAASRDAEDPAGHSSFGTQLPHQWPGWEMGSASRAGLCPGPRACSEPPSTAVESFPTAAVLTTGAVPASELAAS